MQLAKEVERHEAVDHGQASSAASYIAQKAEVQAQKDPTILASASTSGFGLEALGGFGVLITSALALWQRSQKIRMEGIAREVAELPPEEAKKTLRKNRIA